MWPHTQPSLQLQAATVGSTFPNVAGAPVPVPVIPGTTIPLHGPPVPGGVVAAQAAAAIPAAPSLMPNPALFAFGGTAAAAAVAQMAAAAKAAKDAEAEEAAANAAENGEDEEVKANTLEVSHDGRYNVNHVLQDNILKSDYFKSLYDYKTFHEVMEEIIHHVKDLEPHTRGHNRTPSTAFCLLYKFFVMKLTLRQVRSLISNEKHVYVRGMGCLYLRFIAPAKSLWGWFEDLFDDDTEFCPSNDGVSKTTFGKWVEGIVAEQKYYTTLFPRIPVPVMREYKKKFLLREMQKQRDVEHEKYRRQFTEGLRVEAEYHEDHKWYPAQIEKILPNGKYLMTFKGYSQKEVCSIGQLRPSAETRLKPPSSSKDNNKKGSGSSSRRSSRSKSRSSRSKRRSRSRSKSKSRSKRRRSRSRSKSRGRDSKRSRRRHSRSNSLKSSSKSRSRSRSRSKKRKSRSRSRSHSRRSSRRSRRSSRSGKSSSRRSRRSKSRSRSRDRSSRRKRRRHSRSRSRSRKRSSRKHRSRSRSKSSGRSSRRKKKSGSRSRSRDRNSKKSSRRNRDRDRSRSSSSRGSSSRRNGHEEEVPTPTTGVGGPDEMDLEAIIRQRERDQALAVGRDYAKRPTSYKTSLSTPLEVGTARKRSRSPPPVSYRSSRRTTKRSPSPEVKKKKKPSKEHLEKMAKLREQYGDASANKGGDDSD